MSIYSGYSHSKRWFPIAMLVYQRVSRGLTSCWVQKDPRGLRDLRSKPCHVLVRVCPGRAQQLRFQCENALQLIHIMTNVGTRMSKPIHLGMATIPPTKMVMTHGNNHGILSTWTTKISGTRCRSARNASGSWPFYPLPVELRVKPPILIPRPETEELVDRIINDFKEELGPRRLGQRCPGIPRAW